MLDKTIPHFYSKTRSELASEYGITRKTLYNWLKKENIALPSGTIKPCDVQKIYQTFGIPRRGVRNYPELPTFTQKNKFS